MMRRFHVKFNEKKLTVYAGLCHLGRFADQLDLPKMLSQFVTIKRGDTAEYQVADSIMMLAMAAVAGAKHMSHMFIIRADFALRSLFKWEKFPDDTTIARIFKLFSPKHCKELSDVESIFVKKYGARDGSVVLPWIWTHRSKESSVIRKGLKKTSTPFSRLEKLTEGINEYG